MLSEPFTELVVLSHLRWSWVWQRPQHLISRLGARIPTTFVEEPVERPDCGEPTLAEERMGHVNVLHLEIEGAGGWSGFGDARADSYAELLTRRMPPRTGRVVWLYTAMALDLAEQLQPDLLVYDVMDDLTSFKGASPEHRFLHHAALRRADLVFTG